MSAKRKPVVCFDTSREERRLIAALADRAVVMARAAGWKYPNLDAKMDLTACHLNGCPLDLYKLAAFNEFNFAHDVFGIYRHIDRETGELRDCFIPRCARREPS